MPTVFNSSKLELKTRQSPIPEFSWKTSPCLAKLVNSEDFEFDIRSLEIFEASAKVDYYKGEENVKAKWPKDFVDNQR